ncbi:hypothetical protein HLB42_08900 [Deinococcus sp. D7000]|nr:hypothetical protein HLB42_08900 [Deinococcus sp. D7000]
MSAPVVSASGLLALLTACGAVLKVDEGEVLALSGKRPPTALLEEIKARRAEVVAHLKGANPMRATSSPALSSSKANEPKTEPSTPPLPNWDAVAAQQGHCGSCDRAEDAPEWGTLMMTCTCPPHAFAASLKPLALHIAHRCIAHGGRGYRPW